jgi:hypothetical protein
MLKANTPKGGASRSWVRPEATLNMGKICTLERAYPGSVIMSRVGESVQNQNQIRYERLNQNQNQK